MCSRVACFPPQLTHYFIERYTKPGDTVLDIFSGTGTAPLQACLDNRIGLGNDVSPEAALLTWAKLDVPGPYEFLGYLQELRKRINGVKGIRLDDELYFGSPFLREKLNLQLYYHSRTLTQLVALRALLRDDMGSQGETKRRLSRFCAALVLGILHGDRPESLSLPLDRSKSLTTNHIKKMQKAHPGKYEKSYRDVIGCITMKAEKVFRHVPPKIKGFAFSEDASRFMVEKPVNLVITSPPYFSAHTYPYDNRHRLWFLGYDYRDVQRLMFQTSNVPEYSSYLLRCLKNVQQMLSEDSVCVLVVGDVEMVSKGERFMVKTGEQIANAWTDSKSTEMTVESIVLDPIPLKSRRYIHVPVTKGIKLERIVIFYKGHPKTNDVRIDWTVRPGLLKDGPDWPVLFA